VLGPTEPRWWNTGVLGREGRLGRFNVTPNEQEEEHYNVELGNQENNCVGAGGDGGGNQSAQGEFQNFIGLRGENRCSLVKRLKEKKKCLLMAPGMEDQDGYFIA